MVLYCAEVCGVDTVSVESLSGSYARSQDNKDKTVRPNIDYLIKKILVERRQERKKTKVKIIDKVVNHKIETFLLSCLLLTSIFFIK